MWITEIVSVDFLFRIGIWVQEKKNIFILFQHKCILYKYKLWNYVESLKLMQLICNSESLV